MSVSSLRVPAPFRSLLAGASLLVIAGALPTAAAAAEEPAQGATPVLDQDNGDIIVTATRRAESSKNVPVADTVISGEKLAVINSSGLDIRFLSSRTPSLQIESSFGRTFPRFYIRGLGNTDFDPNAARPVSVVYDDVALENAMLKSFPVFDLASVEVLRGPQGTLFGRNTPAGVVKLDSAKPNDDKLSGYGSVSWATYDTINAEAALNVPLGGGWAFRASGLLQYRDDWVTNTSTTGQADKKLEGYRDLAGRFQLGYSSGDFNALLNGHVRDLDGTPRVFRAGLFKPGSNDFNTGFDPSKVALDGYTSQSMTQWGTNLRLDYHFEGVGTLYSVTAFEKAKVESTGDIDGGNTYNFPTGALNDALFPDNTGGVTRPEEFSQEIRFASEDMGGLRLLGGAYYFHQKLNYSEFDYTYPPTTRAANLDQDIEHRDTNENYGIFGSIEWKAIDWLTLRAGVRYSHDHKDDKISGYSPNLFGVVLPLEAKATASDVTWDVSATIELSKNINFYERIATGYQGPAIQDRVTFGSTQNVAKKQTTISGEAGFKGSFADGKVHFDVDGYLWSTKDLQITAVGGATNSAHLFNTDAIGSGFEAEFDARPIQGLTLTAGGSYNFTKITDPNIAVGVCGGTVGCHVLNFQPTPTTALIYGNPLPQAPKWVANVTARYGVPIGDGEAYIYTDWAYRSTIDYFLYDATEFRGRPLLEGGLKIGYKMHNGIEVAAFSRNITNQIRSISAIDFNNLTGMINDPRIIGGEVKFSF